MNPVVEKILSAGLIDRTVVSMFEKSGALPEGSSEKVKEGMINASRTALREFADELYELITEEQDKAAELRETVLDLKSLKWPVEIHIQDGDELRQVFSTVLYLRAMQDLSGRYYVRTQDVNKDDLVPGMHVIKYDSVGGKDKVSREIINEVREMFVDDKPVCYLISTNPEPQK